MKKLRISVPEGARKKHTCGARVSINLPNRHRNVDMWREQQKRALEAGLMCRCLLLPTRYPGEAWCKIMFGLCHPKVLHRPSPCLSKISPLPPPPSLLRFLVRVLFLNGRQPSPCSVLPGLFLVVFMVAGAVGGDLSGVSS